MCHFIVCDFTGASCYRLSKQSSVFNEGVDVAVSGTVMLLCTTAGSLAAGVPFVWLPAPLLAACGLALYSDTGSLRECVLWGGWLEGHMCMEDGGACGKPSPLVMSCTRGDWMYKGVPLRVFGLISQHFLPLYVLSTLHRIQFIQTCRYSIFVAGAAATGGWFVWHHFWFLEILVGNTELRLLCKLLLVALVPAILVPGLVVARAPKLVIGALLMLQVRKSCGRLRHFSSEHLPSSELVLA